MEPHGNIHQIPSLCSLTPTSDLLTVACSSGCGLALAVFQPHLPQPPWPLGFSSDAPDWFLPQHLCSCPCAGMLFPSVYTADPSLSGRSPLSSHPLSPPCVTLCLPTHFLLCSFSSQSSSVLQSILMVCPLRLFAVSAPTLPCTNKSEDLASSFPCSVQSALSSP